MAIRSENDKEIIKHFTKDQKRIYDDWRSRRAERMEPASYEQEMEALERMFAQLCT